MCWIFVMENIYIKAFYIKSYVHWYFKMCRYKLRESSGGPFSHVDLIAFVMLRKSHLMPIKSVNNRKNWLILQSKMALQSFRKVPHSHILMPSSSIYYGRISSPRLKILPLGLEILCKKFRFGIVTHWNHFWRANQSYMFFNCHLSIYL